jgi:hypothetical protein
MFALCGTRTRDLSRSRRVFRPLRQIGRRIIIFKFFLHYNFVSVSRLRNVIINKLVTNSPDITLGALLTIRNTASV